MIDVIARAMAAAAAGGASQGYTKAEADQKFQDKITANHLLSSDLVNFNLTDEQIKAIHDSLITKDVTQTVMSGDNITIMSDTETDGDNIDIKTESAFAYKNEIYL